MILSIPGWYRGRTIHIHIKVHLGGTYNNATSLYSGGTTVHTGQLFFNDTLSELVAEELPYSSHTVERLLNSQDGIYAGGGSYTLMNIQYENSTLGFFWWINHHSYSWYQFVITI